MLTLTCAVLVAVVSADSATPLPRPMMKERATAERLMMRLYGDVISKAKTAEKQTAAVRKILEDVERAKDDPAGQFVLLCVARNLAILAQDRKLAMEVATIIAERFAPDGPSDPNAQIEFGDDLIEQAKKSTVDKRLALHVEAAECYLWVKFHGKGLYRQLAEKKLAEMEPEKKAQSAAANGDTLVVWNTHNGGYGDRGALQFDVAMSYRDRVVWEKKSVGIEWNRTANPKAVVELPKRPYDIIRVTVTKWQGVGGGLAEMQILRRGQNIALGCPARASVLYHETVATPAAVVDGLTEPEVSDKGYWLLPSGMPGWIEIQVGHSR